MFPSCSIFAGILRQHGHLELSVFSFVFYIRLRILLSEVLVIPDFILFVLQKFGYERSEKIFKACRCILGQGGLWRSRNMG